MVIEPKIKYVFLDDVGHYFIPMHIIQMERSKGKIIDGNIIHPISDMAEYAILRARQNKKKVSIRREAVLAPMIEIDDLELWDEDINLTKEEVHKRTIMMKVSIQLATNMAPETQLALYNFNILNAKFGSKGYFITDENKQEIYIKIIEANDDDLLDDLEEYLDAKTKVDKMYRLYRKVKHIKKELQYTDSIEEMDKLFDEFIRN